MATDYNKLKVVDLKAELKRLGLPQNGLKAELVARLEEAAAGDGSETPADADADADTDAPNGDADESTPAVPETDAGAADASHEEPAAALGDTDAAVPEEAEKITMEDAPSPSTAPIAEPAAATDDAAAPASPPPASQSAGAEDVPASGDAMSTENEPVAPVEPTGVLQDSQKRKRRSASPAPVAEDVARKRSKLDEDDTNTLAAPVQGEEANEPVLGEPTAKPEVEMGGTHDPIEPAPGVDGSPARDDGHLSDRKEDVPMQGQDPEEAEQGPQVDTPLEPQLPGAYETEVERDVEPSIHPATSALYIKNFMRPLRPQAVQEHLLQLATPVGLALDDNTVVDFYLDNIRTHAFVVFNSTSAASRVRTALHDIVWPEESNRKPLWVDYMPPQVFHDWVKMEQPGGGRGASGRYEVIYDQDDSGNVTTRLEETGAAAPATKAPPLERKPSIPTGPRGMAGIENAPSGPRGFQGGGRTLPVHPSRADSRTDSRLDSRMDDVDDTRTTRAYPVVSWTPVSIDLVDRRLSAIGAAKTKDYDRDFGKEYKRYFFERGDQLVDRGPEIFLGIRPPHRERERRRELEQGGNPGGGGGFGGGGFGGGFGGGPGGRRDGPGGGRRRRRNWRGGPSDAPFPMPHGVPRGGDRYRGTASSSSTFDDRGGGGGGRFRGDSYRH